MFIQIKPIIIPKTLLYRTSEANATSRVSILRNAHVIAIKKEPQPE